MSELADIYNNVTQCFDQLWSFKKHGDKVLEIITPYSTTSNKFVSLFVTERDGKFIISDGGLLYSEAYESQIDYDNQCLLKILYHLESFYEVNTTEDKKGYKHYYKTTKESKYIPNMIYEMAQFISMCASSATVPFVDKEEKEEKLTFRKEVNTFLGSIVQKDRIKLNASLDKGNLRTARFNALVTNNGSISLINYVTGSNPSYFAKSISNASVLFEIAENSKFGSVIENKIAVLNNSAEGFVQDKLYKHLEILEGHTGQEPVNWTEKEKLKVILN